MVSLPCTMDRLMPGRCGRVCTLLPGPMQSRLEEIGFARGNRVCCVRRSLAGDAAAYALRGAVLVLCREDAAAVLIRPEWP